jgi:ABC-type Fe3+-hydroxamate transport system substrate-binding protein
MEIGDTDAVQLVDALGRAHSRAASEARIVCLVPSITELLFELGLAAQVVGRTGFCFHPKSAVKKVPKVGGTKDFDLEKIRALEPTHLIVNIDENPKAGVDAAAQFVPNVVVTHPMGPMDNIALYWLVGGIFGREREAEELADRFQAVYREAVEATHNLPRERVLYVIWKDPWMTISRDTYIARTLATVGWDHVEVGSERYPTFSLEQIAGFDVDRVLLSTEPYAFRKRDVDDLKRQLNTTNAAVSLIDAEMTSWYGSRAIEGMRYLAEIRGRI